MHELVIAGGIRILISIGKRRQWNLQGLLIEERHNCEWRAVGVDEPKVLRQCHFAGPPDLGVVDLDPDHVAIAVGRLLRLLVAEAGHSAESGGVLDFRCLWDCSWVRCDRCDPSGQGRGDIPIRFPAAESHRR